MGCSREHLKVLITLMKLMKTHRIPNKLAFSAQWTEVWLGKPSAQIKMTKKNQSKPTKNEPTDPATGPWIQRASWQFAVGTGVGSWENGWRGQETQASRSRMNKSREQKTRHRESGQQCCDSVARRQMGATLVSTGCLGLSRPLSKGCPHIVLCSWHEWIAVPLMLE